MNAPAEWETHTVQGWRGARAWKRGERGEAWPENVAATRSDRLRWHPGRTTPCRLSPFFRAVTGPSAGGGAFAGGCLVLRSEMPAPPPQK